MKLRIINHFLTHWLIDFVQTRVDRGKVYVRVACPWERHTAPVGGVAECAHPGCDDTWPLQSSRPVQRDWERWAARLRHVVLTTDNFYLEDSNFVNANFLPYTTRLFSGRIIILLSLCFPHAPSPEWNSGCPLLVVSMDHRVPSTLDRSDTCSKSMWLAQNYRHQRDGT